MLELRKITKDYPTGNSVVHALRGIDLCFRKNEFVSVLGPSGCGKTTLLNLIGGLDRYTDGDLLIEGVSTKEYRDHDWDAYRNHSIGFVFQSYNLIPHQSVLSNVELALTLSGVSKRQRRQRAKAVLEKVGLGDQLSKRPNQLSGGQMQRVAIARALVNNPSILLADEPTGALDSETSVQIMELLKEVAEDRLVIMVTHNPELAEKYSTRIIRLLDGTVVGDTSPYVPQEEQVKKPKRKKHVSMSFLTALGLSFNNLMTKKTRTILIAFAGSIGIIGIALILSMSNGIQNIIDRTEKETLASYPLTIEKSTIDFTAMMSTKNAEENDIPRDDSHIYSANVMTKMMDSMLNGAKKNDLKKLKEFIESGESGLEELTSDIRYSYNTPLNVYHVGDKGEIQQVNPNTLFAELGMGQQIGGAPGSGAGFGFSLDVWSQLSGNKDLLSSQYDILAGKMPESFDEVVLIADKDNQITDFTLYSLGILDPTELKAAIANASAGEEVNLNTTTHEFSYNELLSTEFRLLVNTDYYQKNGEIWEDKSKDVAYLSSVLERSVPIRVVGIIKPAKDSTAAATSGVIGYRGDLMLYLLDRVNSSEIVREQQGNPSINIFTGMPFTELVPEEYVLAAYEDNLKKLGVADPDNPDIINIYPINFESKDRIVEILDNYSETLPEGEELTYNDYIGLMISSITTIINAISYILIAFVAVSLVVSSIMIGIITYISVLERTREIGVLRSIGASKRDISRVFNAETVTIGFTAGILGIGITLLLILPINVIIEKLTSLSNAAALPVGGAIILVAISMLLTFIAGLIPSKIASRKDPVIALRSE